MPQMERSILNLENVQWEERITCDIYSWSISVEISDDMLW